MDAEQLRSVVRLPREQQSENLIWMCPCGKEFRCPAGVTVVMCPRCEKVTDVQYGDPGEVVSRLNAAKASWGGTGTRYHGRLKSPAQKVVTLEERVRRLEAEVGELREALAALRAGEG